MEDPSFPQITLYSYVTSPFAMKVHCYLLYKRLPFDVFYVNPLKPGKELPLGRQVPVLKIDEVSKNESSSIGIWLDEKFPHSPPLVPENDMLKQSVFAADQWVSENLIPSIFFSIYPKYSRSLPRDVKNTLRLGYCVDRSTTNGLTPGIRYLWPLLIRNARFIRRIITPLKDYETAKTCRTSMFSYMEDKLQEHQYLAVTSTPSLADFSAWPSIVVPYQLGLDGFDDFKAYSGITRWVDEVNTYMQASRHAPPIVPETLKQRDLI